MQSTGSLSIPEGHDYWQDCLENPNGGIQTSRPSTPGGAQQNFLENAEEAEKPRRMGNSLCRQSTVVWFVCCPWTSIWWLVGLANPVQETSPSATLYQQAFDVEMEKALNIPAREGRSLLACITDERRPPRASLSEHDLSDQYIVDRSKHSSFHGANSRLKAAVAAAESFGWNLS